MDGMMNRPMDLADIRNLIVAAMETLLPETEANERAERTFSLLKVADHELGQMMAIDLLTSK